MEKNMETTIMGYIGTTVRIQTFIPRYPKVSKAKGFYRVQTLNPKP